MTEFSETGKVPDAFFRSSIYPFCGKRREEVKTPPQYGVDVSLVSMPNGYEMALTSDPLTLIPTMGLRESAWLSVHLMANDMATTGKAPMYAQFVLNLPSHLSAQDFDAYWKYIHHFCEEMGTAITGGHTGRFDGLESTVAGGGTMITIAPQGEMLTSKGAGEGDVIVITKESALIATSILALSFPEHVKKHCGAEIQQEASALFYETTALQAGITAAGLNTNKSKVVTAMHDATEGGIIGAIYEMSMASGCGVEINVDLLPTGAAQKSVCALFSIDPHYCIGAGSMIIAVKEANVSDLLEALKVKGIKATAVGKFTGGGQGRNITKDGITKPLSHPGTDPYWKAFYSAFAQGLK